MNHSWLWIRHDGVLRKNVEGTSRSRQNRYILETSTTFWISVHSVCIDWSKPENGGVLKAKQIRLRKRHTTVCLGCWCCADLINVFAAYSCGVQDALIHTFIILGVLNWLLGRFIDVVSWCPICLLILNAFRACLNQVLIYCTQDVSKHLNTSQWAHDAIKTSSLRQNDVGDVMKTPLLRHVSVGIRWLNWVTKPLWKRYRVVPHPSFIYFKISPGRSMYFMCIRGALIRCENMYNIFNTFYRRYYVAWWRHVWMSSTFQI